LHNVLYISIFIITIFTGLFPQQQNAQETGLFEELPRHDYIAFVPGEKLKYDLHFGSIHAGEGNFEVKPELKIISGKPHYHIAVTGKSYKVFDPFHKVRDYYESFVNKETLLPSVFIRDVLEGKYKDKEYYIFDRLNKKVNANNEVYASEDNIHDIVSVFYYLRCIDFNNKKVGYSMNLKAFFDEEIFPMGVTYTGKKTISTPIGKVTCKVFKPKLIEGRVFQDQQDMTIYVSDDKNQIPIRIESKVYLGFVRADLIKYSGLKFPFSSLGAKK
jgi:hypothetical protein